MSLFSVELFSIKVVVVVVVMSNKTFCNAMTQNNNCSIKVSHIS